MAYSPVLGRWITEDPSEYEGGDVNLYRMEGNNPNVFVDPSGLKGELSVKTSVQYPTDANRKSWGNFFVGFQWKVTGDGDLSGMIIQHVKGSAKIDGSNVGTTIPVKYKNKRGNMTTGLFDLNGADYYEAWLVSSKGEVLPFVDWEYAWKDFRPLARKGIFPELAKSNQTSFPAANDIFGFTKEGTIGSKGGSIKIEGEAYYIGGCTKEELQGYGFTMPNLTGEFNNTGAGGKLWGINTADLNQKGTIEDFLKRLKDVPSVKHSVESTWGADGMTTLNVTPAKSKAK